MSTVKPTVKFKTYKQAAAVGGKIYGVANLADPVVPNVTMAEVIDLKKLHNYSADTLEALLSQVISGVADLVARDGRPRNLSDLLKFEPTIKGTFDNMQQSVTTQKIVIRPRLLKEMRVNLPADAFSWQNQNDDESPRLLSVALRSESYVVDLASGFNAAANVSTGFGFTFAGTRLCPNGWQADVTNFYVKLVRGSNVWRFDNQGKTDTAGDACGVFEFLTDQGVATANAVEFSKGPNNISNAWLEGSETEAGAVTSDNITVSAGETIIYGFSRVLPNGETYTSEKRIQLRG